MPDQPIPQGPPLFNRGWNRRGYASSPPFARSVPTNLQETYVLIERRDLRMNDFGGFEGGNWRTIYNGPCHAEHHQDDIPTFTGTATVPVAGTTIKHWYEIFMDIPADPAQMPQKRDRVTFSDGYEVHVHPIQHVELPDGLTDHLEMLTEEYEA
jgi:hypothetical protein